MIGDGTDVGECRFEYNVTWMKLVLGVCAQVNEYTSCSCIMYSDHEYEQGLSAFGMRSNFQKSMQAGNQRDQDHSGWRTRATSY